MKKIGFFLLAAVALAVAIPLAGILIKRKLYREFPFFFAYVSSSILIPVIRVCVSGNYQLFFLVSWATEAIYALLALLALHEVFRKVFRIFYKKPWFWVFFPSVVVAISVLSVIYRLGSPPAQANRVMSLIISMGMAVNLVQAGLFILFFVLVWLNGISWREYPFGIVMGFAAIAIVTFGAQWARSEFGTRLNILSSYAPSVAYILAVILWLEAFLRPPEPEPRWALERTPEQLLEELRQYAKFIERLKGRLKW